MHFWRDFFHPRLTHDRVSRLLYRPRHATTIESWLDSDLPHFSTRMENWLDSTEAAHPHFDTVFPTAVKPLAIASASFIP
jgi:hypothetical protein